MSWIQICGDIARGSKGGVGVVGWHGRGFTSSPSTTSRFTNWGH